MDSAQRGYPPDDPQDGECARLRARYAELTTAYTALLAERDALAQCVQTQSTVERVTRELRDRERHAMALAAAAQAINATTDLSAALTAALTQLITGLNGMMGAIFLLGENGTALHFFAAHHASGVAAPNIPLVLRLTDLPLTQKALETGIPAFTEPATETPVVGELKQQFGVGSGFAIPLVAGTTHLGVAFIQYADPHYRPDAVTRAFAQAMGVQCAFALEKARLIETANSEHARLRAILDIAPVGISVWDRAGRVIQTNDRYIAPGVPQPSANTPFAESLTAYPFEVEGEDGTPLALEDFPLVRALRGENVPPTFVRLRYPDDSVHEYVVLVQLAPDGQSVVGIYQDVGPLRAALAQAATAHAEAEALKHADTLKNQFISLVAHELRTPLTGIRGFAELLEFRELAPAVVRAYAGKIALSTRRMQDLLDEYLDIQRLEVGAETFQFAWVAPTAIVQAAIAALPPDRVILLDAADVPEVWVDAGKLRRVIDNLIGNALKYSAAPAPVHVHIVRDDETVVIRVTDQGIGIPVAVQSRIFEKFFRVRSTDPLHNQTGTGLGLAICREIVLRMYGQIGFDAEPKGTTFWVRLPQRATAPTPPPPVRRRQHDTPDRSL